MFFSLREGLSNDHEPKQRTLCRIKEELLDVDVMTTFCRRLQLQIWTVSMNGRFALIVMLVILSQSMDDQWIQSLPLMTTWLHPTVLDTSRELHLHPTLHTVSLFPRSMVISSMLLISTFIFTSCENPMSFSVTLARRVDAIGPRFLMQSEMWFSISISAWISPGRSIRWGMEMLILSGALM